MPSRAPLTAVLRRRGREKVERLIADLKEEPSGRRFRFGAMVLAPLLFCLALTFWARFSGFDLGAQQLFYRVGGPEWSLGEIPFWKFLYRWGTIPAAVLIFSALTLYCLSWSLERFRIWRKVFLFIVLTAVIGPGIISNGILKEYWGRPRPREVTGMGGRSAFEPVLTIDRNREGLSFPCGHATMGFLFMGGYFLFRRHRAGLAQGFLLGGLALGGLMGIARMVQGGHFFTDVIWAGLICYFVPLLLYYAMGLDRSLIRLHVGNRKKMPIWMKVAVSASGLAMLAAVLLATPYHEERDYTFQKPFMESGLLRLRLIFTLGTVDFVPAERFHLSGESLGHGVPTSAIKTYYEEAEVRDFGYFVYAERISGWFSEVDSQATLEIPWARLERLRMDTAEASLSIHLAKVEGTPFIELISGTGEVVIHTADQPVRLVEGDATRIVGGDRLDSGEGVGGDRLDSGEGGEGTYQLQIGPEFTGTVRLVGGDGKNDP
ncbi:MAG: phosphatase PAP2 family protein [Verrucomicrobiaceae bacterium]|nr:phosphatase PAP2 family protein [Verrucomicrobiaceae bacterium]